MGYLNPTNGQIFDDNVAQIQITDAEDAMDTWLSGGRGQKLTTKQVILLICPQDLTLLTQP